MNLTYTERYLVKDLSKKGFKAKYKVKGKKRKKVAEKPKTGKKWNKTKKERQEWWRNLTLEQQSEYIRSRQARKAEERQDQPERALKYNPKYPWLTEGVNESNRDDWLAMIHKKNPWLNESEPRLPFADQTHLDSIKQERC